MELSRLGNQGVYVCNGDVLILSLTTSDASGSVVIRGRVLYRDHEIMPFERVCTFSATGTQSDVVATLTEGYLLGFDVSRLTGDLGEGEVIASVHVGRNAGNTQQKMMCLASGDVSNVRSLGMGGFSGAMSPPPIVNTTVPLVVPTSTTIAAPAAGAFFQTTVPATEIWQMQSIRTKYTASATVADRELHLVLTNGAVETWRQSAPQKHVANQATHYIFGSVGTGYLAGSNFSAVVPMPVTVLGPNSIIKIEVFFIQAADFFDGTVITYSKQNV